MTEIDVVTLSNLHTGITCAERHASTYALTLMARHLRCDHGWSRRKVARTLGVREKWVRDHTEGQEAP